jgi:quercetin dioxygenase-like cupin family protein
MPFIKINDYESIELMPGVRARTPYGTRIMLSYLEMEAGSLVPMHQHPHEQAGLLIEGRMELVIGDESRICEPGDMFIIPPDTPHSARPIDGPVKALDVFSPVREDYAAKFNQYFGPA